MPWTYLQTGKLIVPSGEPAAHEFYSGYAEHANVPADEGLKGLGCIPTGKYTMTALLRDTPMGPVAIHLVPDADTLARITDLGRDGCSFYLHDGHKVHDHLASEGCIVSVDGTEPVLNIWGSVDHELIVESGVTES